MNPKISIIVPVYNLEKDLPKCIDSILGQNFTDFEVILVNDGSTDSSGTICDEYKNRDGRIQVIHKENGGVSSARNAGVALAKGEYIGFVDGDDRVEPDMYLELYRLCIETESDIAICRLGREINGKLINKGREEFIKIMDREEAMRQLFKGVLYRFSLCNKLFKKKCFDGVFFPEGRIHEDLAAAYKLFSKADQTVFTNYIGYIYVKRNNSILTARFNEKRLDAFLAWNEILGFMNQNYPQLGNTVHACFAYACVDNMYYILNQVADKQARKKYLSIIQLYVKKFYKNLIKNGELTRKYQQLLFIMNYWIELFVLFHGLKNFRKGLR